jgi:protein TonB
MRRRFRLAVWGTVLAAHSTALAGTAWVQWRIAHAPPDVRVTVAPPPPAPPRTAAPQRRRSDTAPARSAAPTPVRHVAAPRRAVTVAARSAPVHRRRVTLRALHITQTDCVAEQAALPASSGSPAGAIDGTGSAARTADHEAAPLPGCPQPRYPSSARRAGHTGLVVLRVHLDVFGNVLAVLLEHSSGHRALDHAARDAVLHWRFSPRVRGGTAVPCELLQPVSFQLE